MRPEGIDWINLSQVLDSCWALVNTVKNNKMFSGYKPCKLVKRRKKPMFQGTSLTSSSGC
jgi:hypothetical protein